MPIMLCIARMQVIELEKDNCEYVETEVSEGQVGLKYVKNVEEGWTPVVRRRNKRTSESGDSRCELYVDGERQMEYKCLKGWIPRPLKFKIQLVV